jgi:hypothetical protein
VKNNLGLEAKILQMVEQKGVQLSATLYYKYGFDRSGSHHRAMQPDANKDSEEVILYDNERPNNPHSSRPVQLAFDNENSASIQAENQLLKQEINSLEKFFLSEDPKIDIEFKALMTMVDGKVVSALMMFNITSLFWATGFWRLAPYCLQARYQELQSEK